jgi:subtilisin-like proprotein convertase family protein
MAQQNKPSIPHDAKELAHAQMRDLAARIDQAKANGASVRYVNTLQAEYAALSASLGGDDPAQILNNPQPAATNSVPFGPQQAVAPSCSSVFTANFAGTTGAIADPVTSPPFTSSFVVSGLGTYLWDINLNTAITHTACADLDITLTSPSGTVIVITTDNGGTNDNVFNGTLWDDNVNVASAPDRAYTNLVTATPLSPEGRLQNFRGEDPNGTWLLKIVDDAATNTGTLVSASLDITTLAAAPTQATTNFTKSPGLLIPPGAPTTTSGTTTDTMVVSGVDTYLTEVNLYMEITHTYAGDLDMTLTSPVGTIV